MTLPCIVRPLDQLLLARPQSAEQVLGLEGNWYFHPDCINRDVLKVSERVYVCPYKGTCWWVDAKIGDSYFPDIAWVYPEPHAGFRRIAGWYGFYPSSHGFVKIDCP
jgi:uncharacterized protein (DUF427 family)